MSKKSMIDAINLARDEASSSFKEAVPFLGDNATIQELGEPILAYSNVYNEFIEVLLNKIVSTAVVRRLFRSPLRWLEGERMPLGYVEESIYTNPAMARDYNVNDFAGLLKKYESDVKVQYHKLNWDKQYVATIARTELQKAFVSWGNFESFVNSITDSLYNGAYIDDYRVTKTLVSSAYQNNSVVIEVTNGPTTSEDLAKEFLTKARTYYLNFASPSQDNNAWAKVGGSGRPVTIWSDPEDIIFILRNDIAAYIDVNVLAAAFNLDRSTLLGRIIYVDNFNGYNEDGSIAYDGSNIFGMIADRRWFHIKPKDLWMDTFYNPNNRTWQYYLNNIKMFSFSLFANAVVFATEEPEVATTDITIDTADLNLVKTVQKQFNVTLVPNNSTQPITLGTIPANVTATINERTITINVDDAYTDPTVELSLTSGNITKPFTFTVSDPA